MLAAHPRRPLQLVTSRHSGLLAGAVPRVCTLSKELVWTGCCGTGMCAQGTISQLRKRGTGNATAPRLPECSWSPPITRLAGKGVRAWEWGSVCGGNTPHSWFDSSENVELLWNLKAHSRGPTVGLGSIPGRPTWDLLVEEATLGQV